MNGIRKWDIILKEKLELIFGMQNMVKKVMFKLIGNIK
jgi:hypothetical protein